MVIARRTTSSTLTAFVLGSMLGLTGCGESGSTGGSGGSGNAGGIGATGGSGNTGGSAGDGGVGGQGATGGAGATGGNGGAGGEGATGGAGGSSGAGGEGATGGAGGEGATGGDGGAGGEGATGGDGGASGAGGATGGSSGGGGAGGFGGFGGEGGAGGSGGNGFPNICPMLFVLNAVPSTIRPGNSTALVQSRAQETDGFPQPVMLTLRALFGSFENTENIAMGGNVVGQDATYICAQPGEDEVCVDATDGLCVKTSCTDVTCPDPLP